MKIFRGPLQDGSILYAQEEENGFLLLPVWDLGREAHFELSFDYYLPDENTKTRETERTQEWQRWMIFCYSHWRQSNFLQTGVWLFKQTKQRRIYSKYIRCQCLLKNKSTLSCRSTLYQYLNSAVELRRLIVGTVNVAMSDKKKKPLSHKSKSTWSCPITFPHYDAQLQELIRESVWRTSWISKGRELDFGFGKCNLK